ncbi:hypothetical protein C8R46DRAFT_1034893 [Mycena filopes]|nr:hypothetical protein C8R46DRAFT_1034893 [Mycena filopes]
MVNLNRHSYHKMESPSLLFASYRAQVSFDLRMSDIVLPGIAVPGKLLVAQVNKGLVVFFGGIIGYAEPLFSSADWGAIKTEVDAKTHSIIMDLADCTPSGPLFRIDEAGALKEAQPGVRLRIVLDEPAAFWALAYLSAKAAPRAAPLFLSAAEQICITEMLNFFKNDEGKEFWGDGGPAEAQVEDLAPPGYTG